MAGNLKTNSVQLGDSATASQNFVLQTNVDGTAKLARGNLGATTQDILTVDAAGKVDFPVANALDAPVKEVLNASGDAPVYGCRAWVNFNGSRNITDTGASTIGQPVFIRASGNVTSVVKAAVGSYTVNFMTAMPDTNYCVLGLGGGFAARIEAETSLLESCGVMNRSDAGAYVDEVHINVAIFR